MAVFNYVAFPLCCGFGLVRQVENLKDFDAVDLLGYGAYLMEIPVEDKVEWARLKKEGFKWFTSTKTKAYFFWYHPRTIKKYQADAKAKAKEAKAVK